MVYNRLLISHPDGDSVTQLGDTFNGTYGQLLSDAGNGDNLELQIECSDNHGNTKLSSINTIVLINNLSGTQLELTDSLVSGGTTYLGMEVMRHCPPNSHMARSL